MIITPIAMVPPSFISPEPTPEHFFLFEDGEGTKSWLRPFLLLTPLCLLVQSPICSEDLPPNQTWFAGTFPIW